MAKDEGIAWIFALPLAHVPNFQTSLMTVFHDSILPLRINYTIIQICAALGCVHMSFKPAFVACISAIVVVRSTSMTDWFRLRFKELLGSSLYGNVDSRGGGNCRAWFKCRSLLQNQGDPTKEVETKEIMFFRSRTIV